MKLWINEFGKSKQRKKLTLNVVWAHLLLKLENYPASILHSDQALPSELSKNLKALGLLNSILSERNR